MKKITIWDMDFYYKKSFKPSPIAMKISSFHKQESDIVNFVTEEDHISMSYDQFYIIKEKENTPKIPGKLIDDKRVRLIGKPNRFFPGYWEPDALISAVRPDYQLYPENPRDAYYNANIAQFYHEGKLLTARQPFENTIAFHKKTLVIDKEFWDASYEDIEKCLLELKKYKNIAFLHPISLEKIINNNTVRQLFINLHYSQGTIFKFRNNYGHSFFSAIILFQFIADLKEVHEHVKFGPLPFKAITGDHWNSRDSALQDFERCLRIADESKRQKIHIRIISPNNRFDSPFWYYFEILEFWTLYLETKSYIELMLNSAMKKLQLQWFQILNNHLKWETPNTYFLLSILTKMPEWIEQYGYRQWGDEFIDKKLIDWNEVNKYKGTIEDNLDKQEVD